MICASKEIACGIYAGGIYGYLNKITRSNMSGSFYTLKRKVHYTAILYIDVSCANVCVSEMGEWQIGKK